MPALAPQELKARLAAGKPVPAVVLLGADSYLRELCRNALISTYVAEGTRDWALAHFSARGRGWLDAFERAQTLPMLSPRQVLIVEEVEALEELGDKARDAAVDALEAYLADPAPFTVLVLEASALDKRLRLFKALSKNAKSTLIVELIMDRDHAEELALATAKEMGVTMDREAASLLADAVNIEPARIRIEVEKLSLYVHKTKKITSRDVEDLVVDARKHTVWELGDMLADSRREAALDFLDSLIRDGDKPAALVGGIAWRYRMLIEGESRRSRKEQLLQGLAALAEADSLLKSGVKDQRAVMEFLFTKLTLKSRTASPGT
ncbi:MAG: DNA polymerase III subunit delta [Candidatus Acidiferrales bacterium]